MARPERPLDPQAPTGAACLAAQLRALRQEAGSPSYRTMAARTYFAATTLSEAAAGRRMPTLEVTLAYVEACGGDPGEWEGRWRAATSRRPVAAEGPAPAVDLAAAEIRLDEPSAPAATPRRPRWRAMASSLGALMLITAVILVSSGVLTTRPASGSPPPLQSVLSSGTKPASPSVADGQDPKQAGCGADARTLVSAVVRNATGFTYGILELRWSPLCHAGWARYTPDPDQPQPTTVTIAVHRSRPVGATSVTFAVYTGAIFSDMELFKGGCVMVTATTVGPAPAAAGQTYCAAEPR